MSSMQMGFRLRVLSALCAGALSMAATQAYANTLSVDFTVSGPWLLVSPSVPPFGLSLGSTINGNVHIDSTKTDYTAFLSIDLVTGSKTWTLADIAPASNVGYSGGNIAYFSLYFSSPTYFGFGNYILSNNTAEFYDGTYQGTNTFYCNDCVSFSVSSVTPLPPALPLLASGLGAIGLASRVRRRKKVAAIAAT